MKVIKLISMVLLASSFCVMGVAQAATPDKKECVANAKSQGLKGANKKAFMKSCMKGDATTPPASNKAASLSAGSSSQKMASGGGAGKVWVNANGVYHCQGDRYYGKTKQGKYMAEAEAKAAGDRPAKGHACH